MSEHIFFQLAGILVIAFIVSYLVKMFKQPVIIGYILAGILVSPFFIKFGATNEVIDIFSKIGIAFLLFIVGLHLNPRAIRDIGVQSFFIALAQMILTFVLTFVISLKLLELDSISSLYVGIALAFSSTIIVMKLISDKKQLDSLYGRLSIGILIVQDIVAVAVLIFLSSMNGETNFISLAVKTLLIGGGMVAGLFLFGFFVLSRLTKSIARSQELLFLFSICWCFLVAALFAFVGFSLEIGALVAGVVLSITPYSTEISSRIKPLRDFFLIIFFIILGLNIDIAGIDNIIANALILSTIVIIFKPIFLMTFMALFKYTKRTNFLVGTTLAQISEFSLIILILGASLNHISVEILYTLTLTLIITIFTSSYMIIYSSQFYQKMSRVVSIFERKKILNRERTTGKKYDAILFGYNRTGFDILRILNKLKKSYLVVDYNPDVISTLRRFRIPSLYGDAEDREFLDELKLEDIDLAVSTIPDYEVNLSLVKSVRLVNSKAVIIVKALDVKDALELYKNGANYVLTSDFLGGEYVSKMIGALGMNMKKYEEEKGKHIKKLEEITRRAKGRLRLSSRSNKGFR